MSGVADYPVRTCPWPDCKAIWVEDPIMYEDTARCPHCGRDGDSFNYGSERDIGEIPSGSSRQPLNLQYMTRGAMLFVEGGFIKTVQSYNEAEYRT